MLEELRRERADGRESRPPAGPADCVEVDGVSLVLHQHPVVELQGGVEAVPGGAAFGEIDGRLAPSELLPEHGEEPDTCLHTISSLNCGSGSGTFLDELAELLVELLGDARVGWHIEDNDINGNQQYALMARATQNHNVRDTLTSLLPTHPQYNELKAALAATPKFRGYFAANGSYANRYKAANIRLASL